jgi:hypothetical protein
MDLGEGGLGLIEVLFWHSPGGTEKNQETPE